MTANIVTASRILFSLCLMSVSPSSKMFAVLYLLCGATDILDGFLARKLHTESKTGEWLDSLADLFFAVAYAVSILPLLHLPVWILIWTALIAVIKIIGNFCRIKSEKRLYSGHFTANRLTGILIFLLPMTSYLIDVKYGAVVVCIVATVATAEEYMMFIGKTFSKK